MQGAGLRGAPEIVLEQRETALRRRHPGLVREGRESYSLAGLGAHEAGHLFVELALDERHQGAGDAAKHLARVLRAVEVGKELERCRLVART